NAPTTNRSSRADGATRSAFVARAQKGEEKLVRILRLLAYGLPKCADGPGNKLRRLPGFRTTSKQEGQDAAGCQHLRVPGCAASAQEALLRWMDFVGWFIGWRAPVLFVSPVDGASLDIVLGEPSPNQFRFLRVPGEETSLGVPRDIEPGFRKEAEGLFSEFAA